MSSAHPQLAVIEAADDRRQVRHEARMRPGQSCYLGRLVDVVDISVIYLSIEQTCKRCLSMFGMESTIVKLPNILQTLFLHVCL